MSRACRSAVCILLWLLVFAPAARAASTAPLLAAQGKVHTVLVYSDRARITRQATVELPGGRARVHVATLPTGAFVDSVQVGAAGARVVRVQVTRGGVPLPRQQRARALLTRVEALGLQLQAVQEQGAVLEQELSFVDQLRPTSPEPPRYGRPSPARLYVGAWRATLDWSERRARAIRSQLPTLAAKRRELSRALHQLKVEAQGLDLEQTTRPGWQVVATVEGRGKRRLTLSYLVGQARWVPSYDLRYNPSTQRVEATYYAVVRQASGEDWSNARLRFSTARPTELLAVPELPRWTLGRKRDFTPTPRLRHERTTTPWQPPPIATPIDPAIQALRVALGARGKADGERSLEDVTGASVSDRRRKSSKKLDFDADRISGELLVKEAVRDDAPMEQAERAPEPMAEPSRPMAPMAPPARSSVSLGSIFRGRTTPSETLPWTDQGYRPPALHPDLPAAAAEGYRYTLYAPGRHQVAADNVDRRVPLARKRLAVQPTYRVVAGRSRAAYLIATMRNTTGKPILRGHANLFSGTMFAGHSWLNTALPGRELTLPLGVDDRVKVVRRIKQRTVRKGMVFRDDVTEYTVEIEIANNHRRPIATEVEDQIPLKVGDDVEVKRVGDATAWSKPDQQGRIRWQGKIAAGSVKTLSFKFQIVRPKDWELNQHG